MEPPEPPSLAPGVAALFNAYSQNALPPTPQGAHVNHEEDPSLRARNEAATAALQSLLFQARGTAQPCPAPLPGFGAAASSAPAATASAEEIRAVVGHRASSLLRAATHASEMQVRAEISKLEAGFSVLRTKAERIYAVLGARESHSRAGTTDMLLQTLEHVERRWEKQIAEVKRELHDTIVAHNHNADLMADHKTAITQINDALDEKSPHADRGADDFEEQLSLHLESLTSVLKQGEATDQETELLLRRGEQLILRYSALGAALPSHPLGAPTALQHMQPPVAPMYGSRIGVSPYGTSFPAMAL